MSDRDQTLPQGWAPATVGDIGEFINGLGFKSSDWESDGRPIIRIQNLTGQSGVFNRTSRDFDPAFVVRPGTILVSWSATLDVFVWNGPEGILNQHIFKVVPVRSMSDHRFVRWALKRAIHEMWQGEHTHGSTMRHINRGPFLAHPLMLPPLSEQHRIVDSIESHLTRLDEVVALLERVRRNLERYRSSVLRAAVEGRLVPTEAEVARAEGRYYEPAPALLERVLAERRRRWEEVGRKGRYVEPVAPNLTGLPELPEGWCWATVEQLSEVVRGASPRPAGDPKYFGGPVPWITVGDLTRDESPYLRSVPASLTPAGRDASRYVAANTLLLTNSGVTLGVPKITLIAGCINDGSVALLHVPYPLKLYLLYFLHTQTAPLRRINQGAAQPNLNTTIVKAIRVPLPPLDEQARITAKVADLLAIASRSARDALSNFGRAHRLRQSILKWAFEGKLVDQDPSDEPASVLLERIRADRSAGAELSERARPRQRGRPRREKDAEEARAGED